MSRYLRVLVCLSAFSAVAVAGECVGAVSIAAVQAAPESAAPVKHQRRRVKRVIRVERGPYLVVDPNLYRGFHDPGYAYHGNVNGCVIDQGYGRYAPCFVNP